MPQEKKRSGVGLIAMRVVGASFGQHCPTDVERVLIAGKNAGEITDEPTWCHVCSKKCDTIPAECRKFDFSESKLAALVEDIAPGRERMRRQSA